MSSHWLRPHDVVDPAWFASLERFAAVAADHGLTTVDPDHFMYAARIERGELPVLHVYRHVITRRYLNVDENCAAWRYSGSDKVGADRYVWIPTIEEAVATLDLERANQLAGHLRRDAAARWPSVKPDEVASDVPAPVAWPTPPADGPPYPAPPEAETPPDDGGYAGEVGSSHDEPAGADAEEAYDMDERDEERDAEPAAVA